MCFMSRFLIVYAMLFFSSSLFGQSSGIQPYRLTCENSIDRLGIDVREPKLGWEVISGLRNQMQQAYEIIVSDAKKDNDHNTGRVWSTGKVASSESIQITCKALLRSFT